ncbi:hypothetical protein [Facklamia sp. P12934]|uniref:hypothetical protein n=1 Tax=unclassified Facklamia TaxID=2622293 RepID=UPI003D174D9C
MIFLVDCQQDSHSPSDSEESITTASERLSTTIETQETSMDEKIGLKNIKLHPIQEIMIPIVQLLI